MNTFKSMSVMLSLVLGMADTYAVGLVGPGRILDDLGGVAAVPGDPVDKYQFKCPYGTISAGADVADLNENIAPPGAAPQRNTASRMQVMLNKGGVRKQTDDRPAPDGEGGLPSLPAVLAAGPGVYALFFSGTAGGFENYRSRVQCNLPRATFLPVPIQIQDN